MTLPLLRLGSVPLSPSTGSPYRPSMEDLPIDVPALPSGPTKGQRYLFWLILAFLSAFFAEVISGSFPYPFVHPLGLVMVVPLYGLHTLVLAYVVFKVGRPRFSTLFIAGCIFGMYEAYITKVLWNPPWETLAEPTMRLGGVAIMELGVIAFCWHPFMAFIVPLAVAMVLTSSRGMMEAMPERLERWLRHRQWALLLALAVWSGLVMGSQVTPVTAVLANVTALVVMFFILHHFMERTGGRYTMEQLLPDRREAMWLLGGLLLYYGITGPLMRPEALPGFGPQLLIALMYALLFVLLKRSIDVGRAERAEGAVAAWRPSLDRSSALTLFGVYIATATVTSILALLLLGPLFLVLSWFVWALIAVLSFGFSVKDVLGRRDRDRAEPPAELQAPD